MILLDAGVRDPLAEEAALVQGEVELVARVPVSHARLSNVFSILPLYLYFSCVSSAL